MAPDAISAHDVSVKILRRQSTAAHTTRFSKRGVLCAVLLLGSLAHLVSQKHLRCLGSRLVYFTAGGAIRKRVDGQETATTGWTEGKPQEIAWGVPVGKGRDGSDDRVDGGKTVGNSLGRAPLGRSEMEATTRWTEGKLWEIACDVGKERYGSDDRVKPEEMGRRDTEATTGWTDGKQWKIAWGEFRWEGARWKRRQGGRTGNRRK